MTFEASPLHILLLLLVVAGIWAVVELALTIRKARSSLDTVVRSANDTVEQVQPILGKVDGLMDDIQPEVKPLLDRVGTTLDVATVSVAKVNDILADVSDLSGTASTVSATVKSAAASAAGSVVSAVSRLTGTASQPTSLTDGGDPAPDPAPVERDTSPTGSGYISYTDVADTGAAADEAE